MREKWECERGLRIWERNENVRENWEYEREKRMWERNEILRENWECEKGIKTEQNCERQEYETREGDKIKKR